MGLLTFLQNIASVSVRSDAGGDDSIAFKASRLLGNWPNNLTDAIRQDALCAGPARRVKSYRSLVIGVSAVSDVAVLRNSPGLLTVAAQIKLLNETTKNRNSGTPAQPVQTVDSGVPTLETISSVKKSVPASDNTSSRAAAKLIGIPVSALVYLRRVRHYEVKSKTSRVRTFHDADALSLREKLLSLGQVSFTLPPQASAICLGQVLNRKFKFIDGKGALIAAMLSGELSTYGRQGPEVADLLLCREEADAFVARARTAVFDGKLTPAEVARLIGCDSLVVPGLVIAGHLEGTKHAAGLRVDADSVRQFKTRYRPLVSVAKERGTSSVALARKALAAGTVLMLVDRAGGKGRPQPFVRLEDVEALSSPHQD